MKKYFFFLALATFSILGCKDDDDLAPGNSIIKLDGDNNSGPELEAGEHEAAVFFKASTMSEHKDRKLKEVRWFMGPNFPDECRIKIYAEGSNNEPGDNLYEINVTSAIKGGEWNSVELANPLKLDGQGIWISVFLKHSFTHQSIGCDAGPNNDGGDWLFQDSDNAWTPYHDRTPESVNWNIRGLIED